MNLKLLSQQGGNHLSTFEHGVSQGSNLRGECGRAAFEPDDGDSDGARAGDEFEAV